MLMRSLALLALAALLLAAPGRTPTARAGVTVTPLPANGTDSSTTGSSDAHSTTTSGGSDIPTAQEVQSLVDAGRYRDALPRLLRLLDMHGPAATFNRAQMLILRAECQLQIHDRTAALGTLQQAVRTATVAGSTEDAENAQAFAYLIQKSPADTYVPVTGTDRTPLNVLDRSTRRATCKAAFDDLLDLDTQKMKGARAQKSILPLVDLGHDFPVLRGLERQGTGVTTKSDAFAKDASHVASRLINAVLAEDNARITTIAMAADHVVTDGTSQYGRHYHFVGLTAEQARTLDQIVDTCRKIGQAAEALVKSFPNTPVFNSLGSSAQATAQRAMAVRNKNYAGR